MADEPKQTVAFIDNPHAPEFFSTDATGFFRLGSNIMVTFETVNVDHSTSPGPVRRVVIGRLILPADAAQRLVVGLNDFLAKQGLDPSASLKGDAPAQ